MGNNVGKKILENPEKFIAFANKEQLLQAYPEWFEEINVDSTPFFLERKPKRHTGIDHRHIITPSGLIRIEGKEALIWGIKEDSIEILSQLKIYARNEDVKFKNKERINDNAKKFIEIGDRLLEPLFIPYGQAELTNWVCTELETSHTYDSVEEKDIE
jgi:hypothetical protein